MIQYRGANNTVQTDTTTRADNTAQADSGMQIGQPTAAGGPAYGIRGGGGVRTPLPPNRPVRGPGAAYGAPGGARTEQVLTTRVGLQIPNALPFEEWERAGRQLAGVLDSSSWWLGDWLTYGKDHYADRYQQGIWTAGLRYQTLRNYAWVARRFDHPRRHAKLTFQHHAEVASLPQDQQDHWLTHAEQHHWTTKQLRNALRQTKAASSTGEVGDTPPSLPYQLSLPQQHYQRWHQAAQQSNTPTDTWILTTLNNAAERALNHADQDTAVPAIGDEPGTPAGV